MKFTIGLIAVLSDWTEVAMCTPFPSKRPSLLNFRFSNDSTLYPLPGTHRLNSDNPVPLQEDLADDSESSSYHGIRSRFMIPRDSEGNPRPSGKNYSDGNPRPSNIDVCGYPQVDMNATLWDSKQQNETVNWILSAIRDYVGWVKESNQNRMVFQSYLSKAWLKDAGISECNGYYCDVLSCENMRDGYDKDKTRTAFYAMRNIANWNNYQKQLQDDTMLAIGNVRSRIEVLVNDFTDSKKSKAYEEDQQRKKKQMLHIILTVLLMASAATAFIDPAIAPLLEGATLVAKEAIDAAVAMGRGVVGVTAGGYSGSAALVTDAIGQPEDPAESYRDSLHRLFEGMADFLSHDMRNETLWILSGMQGRHGQSIVDIAASPIWLKKRMIDPDRVRQLETRVTEMVINMLWSQQWVYIVEAGSTSCLQDNRIWNKLKVCREGLDMFTYQPLFIGTEMEEKATDGHHQLIQGPPGWQKLEKAPYADTSLTKVVSASREHWGARRYNTTDEAHFREQLLLPGLYNWDKTPPSQWTIPIFRSPNGEALTSIMNKKGRAYPLMTGDCRWDGHITPECNKDLHDFMQATGLYMSKNWKMAADAWDVEFDEIHAWRFEGGGGREIVNFRPINRIKNSKDIGYWGHEEPEDDGTEDHKDGKEY